MNKMRWIGMISIMLFFISCDKNEDGISSIAWEQKSDLIAKNRSRAVGFTINGIGYVGLGMSQQSGQTGQPDYLNDLWSYNPATDQWMERATFPGTNRMGAVVFVVNGKAYVGGGTGDHGAVNDFYEYDPVADEWSLSISMDNTRYSAIAFAVEEKGYVGLGAYYDRQNNFITLNDFWSYDPNQYEWTKLKDFPGESRLNSSVFVIGRKVFITAGCDNDRNTATYYSDTYEYDTENNQWTQKKDFPNKEYRNAMGFSVNGYGYIPFIKGGELWQYSPTTDQWGKKAHFPGSYSVSGVACFVINNKAYFVLDSGNKNLNANELWVYDASKDN